MATPITIEFTVTNDDGDHVECELPGKMVVCQACEGHGTHLREGMRGHAYTAEEFEESFDDEAREEYFKRGGRYDVTCTTCNGKNVVEAVDEDACVTAEQKQMLELYYKEAEDQAAYERECAAERRAGC